jgi:hypothetical protein
MISSKMRQKLRAPHSSLDVGVDAWAFRPVSMKDIRQRLKTLPADPDFASDPDDQEQNPRPRQ